MPDSNTKYVGAWGEISVRIQAREHVLLVFIAVTAVSIGLSLSREEFVNCSLPIGYVALAAAFLSRHHDIVIGNLRRFQNEVAKLDDDGKNTPEYTTMAYLGRALQERSKREYTQILFIVLGMCASIYGLTTESGSRLNVAAVLWYGGLICSVFAIFVTIKTMRDRRVFSDVGVRL